jgi:anti-sigma factor RsiW
LEAYVDGELHVNESSAVEAHVAACEACSRELDLARSLVDQLRALPELRCPEGVAEKAAARSGAGADEAGRARAWLDRLRERLGGFSVPVPRPAMAAVVLVIVAATVFVLTQHEQSPFRHAAKKPKAPTEQDAELAKLEVMLAFAYLDKYSRRTGEIIEKDVFSERVMEPVGKSVVEPFYPFPWEK